MLKAPELSVVIPTHNNLPVLRQCLESWRRYTNGQSIEVLVIEDGCNDETPEFLREQRNTEWGQRHLRVFHEDNVHELRCTNRGFREARGSFLLSWHDDMFLRHAGLVPELINNFAGNQELGLVSLSRGLICRSAPR